jgi:hypothetical protein
LDKNLERIIEGLHKELFDYILPVEEVKPVDRKNSGKRSNDWDLLDPERSLDEIVVEALKTVVIPSSRRLTRRGKRPFVTSYQLATIISKMFPHVVQASGLKFGGKGAGVFCKRFFPKVADLFPQYCMSVFLIIAYVSRPRRGRGNRTIAGMCY